MVVFWDSYLAIGRFFENGWVPYLGTPVSMGVLGRAAGFRAMRRKGSGFGQSAKGQVTPPDSSATVPDGQVGHRLVTDESVAALARTSTGHLRCQGSGWGREVKGGRGIERPWPYTGRIRCEGSGRTVSGSYLPILSICRRSFLSILAGMWLLFSGCGERRSIGMSWSTASTPCEHQTFMSSG